jgi:hypothetical protein
MMDDVSPPTLMPQHSGNFGSVPFDILVHFLSFLRPLDILAARQVSVQFLSHPNLHSHPLLDM